MIVSAKPSNLLSYRAYVEGGEAGGVSALAWLMSQQSGVPALELERALYAVNPLVVIANEDDPLSARLMDGAEEHLYAFCRNVETMHLVAVA